jgi:hypothetical protein
MKVRFLSDLNVTHAQDGFKKLIHDYFVSIEEKDNLYMLKIPALFETDFCSVPRMPFAYLLLGGIAEHAGVLHDALYSEFCQVAIREIGGYEYLEYNRAWADSVFLHALKHCGIGFFKRQLMYAGVRAAGWRYFKRQNKISQTSITGAD